MIQAEPGRARERILLLLKTGGPQDAARLAQRLEVTAMAVRQHLYKLQGQGLVEYRDEKRKVGRPARLWRLTGATTRVFPDAHGELAAGLLEAARKLHGQRGVQRLLKERALRLQREYSGRLARHVTLAAKVAELARIRAEEGYLAECRRLPDGVLELAENHCPICTAARTGEELCDGELELFRKLLPGAVIERTEHITAGARRCLYRIRSQ
ncbi:MAG: transcriptional regulator [Planctomycetes bacterium]|nr:transcriptional regulator [Planctomycetota bacterium]